MQHTSNDLKPRMKSKLYYVVLSLAAGVGFALYTLYTQASSHPVDSWTYYNENKERKVAALPSSSAVLEGLNWPVVRHSYLPNYFLGWEREKSPSVLDYRDGNMVFLHHNKAGGLSIRKCIIKTGDESGFNVSRNIFSYRYMVREFDYWKHAPRTKTHVALYGGYTFGVCDVMGDGRPCSYFTMVRNPYDRIISAYMYCSKNTSHDQLCTALQASQGSVVDWAMHHGSFFFRQIIINPAVCNGSYDDSPYLHNFDDIPHEFTRDLIPCWFKHKVLLERMFSEAQRAALLQHVADNLENYFAVIGLLEHYDLSLAMFQHVYHIPFKDKCSDIHFNKGQVRRLRQAEADAEKEVVKEKMMAQLLNDPRVNQTLHADLVLYEKAQEIFKKQTQVFNHITGNAS